MKGRREAPLQNNSNQLPRNTPAPTPPAAPPPAAAAAAPAAPAVVLGTRSYLTEALTTPVQRYPRAPLLSRYLALLIDGVVPVVFLIPAVVVGAGALATGGDDGIGVVSLLLTVAGGGAAVVYACIRDGLWNGAGVGKRAMGLMVVHLPSDTPCTPGQSTLRTLVTALVHIVPFVGWLLEPVIALIADDGRRLADKAVKTQVVETKATRWFGVPGDVATQPVVAPSGATIPPTSAPAAPGRATRRPWIPATNDRAPLVFATLAGALGVAVFLALGSLPSRDGPAAREAVQAGAPATDATGAGAPATESAESPPASTPWSEDAEGTAVEDVPPPPATDSVALANAAYPGLWGGGRYQLRNGIDRRPDAPLSVALAAYVAGDLNGDTVPDALVVLAANTGGMGVYYHLVGVLGTPTRTMWAGFETLGDRPVIDSLIVRDRRALLWLKTQGDDDPTCCPRDIFHYEFDVTAGQLVTRVKRYVGRDTTE